MLTKRPRGTADILPEQTEKWQFVERVMHCLCREYNFREIRTPVFEHTELFIRGVGEDTDIVEKEMYSFKDRGERDVTLRPEGTAPVVRAYLENNLNSGPQPVKLFYSGPMFRYDRPQAGRYRQFHQMGVEVFGSHNPCLDAEVMAMAMEFFLRLGLKHMDLHINSVGCPECRPRLGEKLRQYFKNRLESLCPNCSERYYKNPLRIIDCKNTKCQQVGVQAPATLECLCSDCEQHFIEVCNYLKALDIPYVINNKLVRGLDYYTHTAFEIMAPDIGAQSSIGGGGRYNNLIKAVGGPAIPGIGYALGVERVILAMEHQGINVPASNGIDVFVAVINPEARIEAFKILNDLRGEGFSADQDYLERSLKAQMKFASKIGARYTLFVGGEEFERGFAVLRDMSTGEQRDISLDEVSRSIAKEVKRDNN